MAAARRHSAPAGAAAAPATRAPTHGAHPHPPLLPSSPHQAFVSYERATGRPRGFGFVVFDDPAVADRVVASPHTIDRREVEAKRAVPKDEAAAARPPPGAGAPRSRKLFVGGLPPTCDDAALRAHFEAYGGVEEAVVMVDHESKRSRGFAFVTLADDACVDAAFASGPMHTIHDKPVEVKRAVPRDVMAAASAAVGGGARPRPPPPGHHGGPSLFGPPPPRGVSMAPWMARHGPPGPAAHGGARGAGPGFAGGALAAELEALSMAGPPRHHYGGYDGGYDAPFAGGLGLGLGPDGGGRASPAARGALTPPGADVLSSGSLTPPPGSRSSGEYSAGGGGGPRGSPPDGARYRSLYAPSDVFGPPAVRGAGGGGEGNGHAVPAHYAAHCAARDAGW